MATNAVGGLQQLPAVAWLLVLFGIFSGAGLWVLAIFFNITNSSGLTQAANGINNVINGLTTFTAQTTNIVYMVFIGIMLIIIFWAIGAFGGEETRKATS
jgi:hypothetical protein